MTKVATRSGKVAVARKVAKLTILGKKDTERFGKAAKSFAGKATSSPKAARRMLVELGTHTVTGKLTKKYR